MKVFIVIPAYNEEKHIATVIQACRNAGFSDIIVIDDNSSDATYAIAQRERVHVVHHAINRGAGAATQTGLEAAKKFQADVIITMDADGQHSPHDIDVLLHPLREQEADIVIGSRFLGKKNKIPFFRRLFNKLANMLTFLLSGTYVTDSQSGFKAFSRRALDTIFITANGFEFSSEIIREASYNKLRIKEVPIAVTYTAYSLSKGQNLSTGIGTIFKLIIRSLMR